MWKQYSRNETMKLEVFLQPFSCKLNQNKFENECDRLYPSGSAFSRIYGSIKMHSFFSVSFSKLHPVAPSIETFRYNLFHCFYDLLSPLIPNESPVRVLFLSLLKFKMRILQIRLFFFTYHGTTLFINIQLQETIVKAIDLNLNNNLNLSINRKGLQKLFLFVTLQTYIVTITISFRIC